MLLKRDLKIRETAPYGRLIFHKIIFQKISREERLDKKQLYQRVVVGRIFDILCRNIHNKIQDKSKGKRKEKAAWN